jgi:hypothetical protein
MLWYRDAQLPLPEGHPATAGQEIVWRLPSAQRINQLLTHPCDAGAFVSGRTAAKTVSEAGRARQTTRQKKPLEQWRIVTLEHHPGYLSWDAYLSHRKHLEANRVVPQEAAGGTAKRGSALRRGL